MNYEITDILMKKIVSLLCKCDIKKSLRGFAAQTFLCPPIPEPFLRPCYIMWKG